MSAYDDYGNEAEDFDDYELISAAYDDVYDAVGDDFTEDEVVEAIRECNYDTKKSVSYLLYGTYPDSRSTANKQQSKPPTNKQNQATPTKYPGTQTNSAKTQTLASKIVATQPKATPTLSTSSSSASAPSALAQDLCAPPVVVSLPPLKDFTSSASNLGEIVAFSFAEPSPDDIVKEKQKMAFSKKPDKPRKDEVHHISSEEDSSQSSTSQKGIPIKYKQNVKTKAVTADIKNLNIATNTSTTATQSNTSVKMHNAARRKSLELKIKTFMEDTHKKDHLNMVVIGHVDAGKSTTMGHLLYKLGYVDAKTIHKYEKEAQQKGKSSFHFAWVLDEHETERSRGVTINVGIRAFETAHHSITLLDAPGHRDFVPNMITGCAQADVAILMLDASLGSFENGFMGDGQTKEHTMLARSLGVTQLIVAINKLDMVDWDNTRYSFIVSTMTPFLKQAGFNPANVAFVPCSGLSGENLVTVSEPKLTKWYSGPPLLERIDMFRPAERLVDKPFRMTINDVYKPGQGTPAGVIVAGKIETGFVAIQDKVLLSPNNHVCTVKILQKNHEMSEWGTAGDNVELGLSGVELNEVSAGHIASDPANKVPVVSKLRGQIVVFGGLRVPITPGTPIEFHIQSTEVPGKIVALVGLVDKATGEQTKAKPRFLTEGQAALVDIHLASSVCMERYKDFRSLARFMLRDHGRTIAAGVVIDLL